jgi:hypothetical protein
LKASTKVGYAYTVEERKGAAVAERLGKQTHANIEFVYRELKKAGFKAGQLHRDMLAAIRGSGRLVDSKGKVYTSDDIADMGAAKRRRLAEDIGIEVTPDMDGMDVRKELFMRIQPDMTPEQFAEKYRLTDDGCRTLKMQKSSLRRLALKSNTLGCRGLAILLEQTSSTPSAVICET